MVRLLKAAVFYFAIVLAAGFILGTIRTLVVAPATGPLIAVSLELPIMLAISWLTSRQLLSRMQHSPSAAERAVMGTLALSLLLIAEFVLATLAFGQDAAGYLEALRQPPGLLGLAGQILFGLIPLLQRKST